MGNRRLNLKPLAAAAIASLTLSGCGLHQGWVREQPQDLPTETVYQYTAANACMGRYVARYLESTQKNVALLVGPIDDGTRNPSDPASGSLSHGGQLLFTHLTKHHIPSPRVSTPFVNPLSVRLFFATGQALPASELARLSEEHHNASLLIGVGGDFIGYDQSITNDGRAISGSKEIGDADLKGEIGQTARGERIRLVLQVGSMSPNRLLGSLNLGGVKRRDSRSYKFTIRVKDFGAGYSRSLAVADGTHSLQENIIAAGWFFTWAMLLPGDEELQCLDDPSSSPTRLNAAMYVFENARPNERVRLIQRALNRHPVLADQPPLAVDGRMGPRTWRRIRAVERTLGLVPHSRGTLGNLYAVLALQVAE